MGDSRTKVSDLTVLDFGRVWAGAIPGQILADMGATVIRIESLTALDPMPRGAPVIGTKFDPNQNLMFHSVNRGKRSMGLNLKHAHAREVIYELVRHSDILIENMRPGVMDRLGLSYETLSHVNPLLIYASMPGMGSGPWADLPTYGPNVTALSGMDGLTGYDDDAVMGVQQAIVDPTAGMFAALAILAAVWNRERRGRGAYLEVPLLEVGVHMLTTDILGYSSTGRSPRPRGNANGVAAPNGIYPCRGDEEWVAISVCHDAEWDALADTMGLPNDRLDRYGSAGLRRDRTDELDALISGWTHSLTQDEVAERLQAAGVPATPVLDVPRQLSHPYFRERGTYAEVNHAVLGAGFVYGSPWKLSGHPPAISEGAPQLGQDNWQIASTMLGMAKEEYDRLLADGLFEEHLSS